MFGNAFSKICTTVFLEGKEGPGRDSDPSPPSSAVVMKGYSYTSTAPIGRTACTEPQCLYKGDLYLYLFFENQAVYEIMWKNIVEPGRPRMTMWRMRIAAGFLRLQIHTLRICNTHCFSTATMVVRTRLDVTLYVHCLSCLLSYPSLYVRIFQAFSYLKFYNKILYAFFFPMRVT